MDEPLTIAEDQLIRFRKTFERWDGNSDGRILKDELPENARAGFNRADANNDGEISLEEHVELLKQIRQEGRGGRN